MKCEDIKISDGPIVMDGDEIEIYYRIALSKEDFAKGKYIEETYNPDIPITIVFSKQNLLPGIYDGIKGMRSAGSQRCFEILPEKGFGKRGWNTIQENTTLFVEVCLARIKSRNIDE
ncbi:FKBP-type peptidyl-prolyl cis-trans isomerase [Kordia sp.]|uniref:FKBP-type peptidyl-prolyl cis-trans isomerase n=1 Tax=Kordia sp. TaxID=1965332 RepID=UPI003D2ADF11